ncbi:MAG: hypothetical protein RL296_135 [Actinomycetota bacterium]|jgi:hypothetical protein
MKLRRPRNSTLFSILIFLVSFGFWLGQPQPVKNYSYVTIPDVVKTDPPVTIAPETTVVDTTISVDTTIDPTGITVPVETTVLP